MTPEEQYAKVLKDTITNKPSQKFFAFVVEPGFNLEKFMFKLVINEIKFKEVELIERYTNDRFEPNYRCKGELE